MATLTSFTSNLAKQKNLIFPLNKITPSASSTRDLGTRKKIENKKTVIVILLAEFQPVLLMESGPELPTRKASTTSCQEKL